jgi:vacuolar-type H+-ATPase subunit E/Vma4
MTVIEQVERIRHAAREELLESRGLLEKAGLTWSEPELVVSVARADEYTAELKVKFYRGDNLVDIFEFFVCRNGVLTTSEDETRQWICKNVPDVVHRMQG